MNSKANKSQIQFPPLLNLCNDRPHVDATFRNWEKNNSPYLNDMISPVYIKDSGIEGIYDYYGRKHQIINGNWTIDGTSYISDLNHKFTRTVLDSLDMLSVAFDNNGSYWYLNSGLQLVKEGQVITTLSVTGTFVTSRIVHNNGDLYIALISKLDNNHYIKFYTYDIDYNSLRVQFEKIITWYRQVASSRVGTNSTFEIITIDNIDPIVNIGFTYGSPWVSLVSNYGQAIDTRHNGFATYYGLTGAQIGNELSFSTDSVDFDAPVHYRDTASAAYTIAKDTNVFLSHKIAWAEAYGGHAYANWRRFSVWVSVGDPTELSTLGLTHGAGYYLCTATTSTVTGNNNLNTQQNKTWTISNDYYYAIGELPFDNAYLNESIDGTFVNGSHSLNTSLDIYVVNDLDDRFTYVNVSFGNIEFANGVTDEGVPTFNVDFNVDLYSQGYIVSESGWNTISSAGRTVKGSKTLTVGVNQQGLTNIAQIVVFYDVESDPYEEPYITWNLGNTPTGTSVVLEYNGTYTYTIASTEMTAYPCVVLDNGLFYTMTGFEQATTNTLSTNAWLPMSASATLFRSTIKFESFISAIHTSNPAYEIRSNSVIVNQNLFAQTIKYTRNSITPTELAGGTAESTNAYAMEVYNSNCTDLKYMPGTSRYTGFNYYSDYMLDGSTSGAEEDRLVYCTIGHRVKVNPVSDGDAGFKLLFNTTTDNSCYIQGISWANSEDYIGTLLTPWQEVSEDFYPAAFGDKVIYKNKYDELVMIQRVEATPEFTAIFDNKYILLNTDNYWNLYDSARNKWFHYASDWNFRFLGGSILENEMSCYYNSVYSFMFRYVAASQNQVIARASSRTLYSNPNIYPVASWQTPLYAKARMMVGDESLYGANEPEFTLSIPLGVDVYYTRTPNTSTSGVGDAYYQYTYNNGVKSFNTTISGQTYTITTATSSFLNPSLFATYLDGAGNNDLVYDLKEAYTVSYYNNIPTFIYLISSEVNGADAFFVIQGQFYAIIDNKICSVSYNNSVLSSKDPIIDINGMKFVGNNPMIAFFWSERYKAFYSFTGDANLEHIYNANKFSNLTGEHYYDKSTQTIYVPTSKGLLCFGPKNTYILEQFKNVSLVQFTSDNVTHIEDSGNDYSLVYYDKDDYQVNNVDLESSFFGMGATESTSIDRWNITLYDLEGEHPSGEVVVGVRSLTDITVKSEEKKVKITPDMWDKWSNSILITYNPKLIKAQGLRLYVNSPFIVQSITAHVMDNGTGTLSNKKGMV